METGLQIVDLRDTMRCWHLLLLFRGISPMIVHDLRGKILMKKMIKQIFGQRFWMI